MHSVLSTRIILHIREVERKKLESVHTFVSDVHFEEPQVQSEM